MIWQELSAKIPWEFVEPVSYLFGRYGHGLSVEDAGDGQVVLRSYVPNTSRRRLARIEVGVNLVRLLEPMCELTVTDLKDTNWETAWKAHFDILKTGQHLVIKPSWLEYTPLDGEVVVELDPGMAFGTGYHPTTQMCLAALERHLQPDAVVLDLGTGSGILAIAAVRLGASGVVALDLDPDAVKASRKNFKNHRLENRIRLVRGTLPHGFAPQEQFDLAMANISGKVVQEKAPHLRDVLKDGGILIAGGFVRSQEPAVRQALDNAGFFLLESLSVEDWVTLLMSRSR